MNVSSKKSKGRRLQQYIVKKLLETFPELTERDIRSTPMGSHGSDTIMSEKAVQLFPYSIESKNCESWSLPGWIRQCEINAIKEDLTPLLIFSKNDTPKYVCLRLDDFLELFKEKRRNG